MVRLRELTFAAILTLSLLFGRGAGAEMAEVLPSFGPGEQSTYQVRYLGMTAGTAQITVGAEIAHWGTRVTPIVALARSSKLLYAYPVEDKFITYWDPRAGRSVGHDLFADENHKRRRQRVQIDHSAGKADVTKQKEGQPVMNFSRPVEAGAMDIAAATFALRNSDLKVGHQVSVPVFTGEKSFRLEATVEGVERLETPLGPKEALRLRVQTQFDGEFRSKRDMRIFLSHDAAHVPLKIEADFFLGTVVAELTNYQPGRTGL